MRITHILMLLLVISVLVSGISQGQSRPRTIAKEEINVRPMVLDSPDGSYVFVAWYYQYETNNPYRSAIKGALLNYKTLKAKKTMTFSLDGENDYVSPFFTALLDESTDQYVALFQQTSEDGTSFRVSSFGLNAEPVLANKLVDGESGTLVGPLLTMTTELPGVFRAIYTEQTESEIGMHSLLFDTFPDGSSVLLPAITWPGRNLFHLVPQAGFEFEGAFQIFAFAQYHKRATQRFISEINFTPEAGFTSFTKRTTSPRNIDGATGISALPSTENYAGEMPIAFISGKSKRGDAQIEAGLFDAARGKLSKRSKLLADDVTGLEVLLVESPRDGVDKILWIQENQGKYELLVAELSQDMELIEDSQVILDSSDFMLTDIAAAFTDKGRRLVVAWSDHTDADEARLRVRGIDF